MRARNIKPGFFKNADLLELPPIARILFAGLWCLSDREGRLLDRPKQIKIEVLPCESCDVDKLLNTLQEKKFITRYGVNGCKYIQVVNFTKHQNPHCKECASSIPAPDLHSANTVQAGLIPDSLNLIPESNTPIPPKGGGVCPCPIQKIKDLYNATLPELPQCRVISKGMEKNLQTRWRENSEHQILDWWQEYFSSIRDMPFLMGQAEGVNFRASFDWIIRPTNFAKILNGNYRREKTNASNIVS